MMTSDFFNLLQVAVGAQACLSHSLTNEEWHDMFSMAIKQSMPGVLFEAIKKLPKEQWPSPEVVFRWTATAENIRRKNVKTNDVCFLLTKKLSDEGFDACILKGQTNHVYYDRLGECESLGIARTCGDIDVWIWPKTETRHPVKTVIDYCRRKNILLSLCHLHAEVKPVKGVPVEIHFRPSFLNAPWSNHVFQRLFKSAKFVEETIDGSGKIKKLRTDYDLIFQMSHIFRHLLDEGVGMRQILDFYVLLKCYNAEKEQNARLMSPELLRKNIRQCGMARFASALMYVLQETIGMGDDQLLCAPSVKHGQFLLSEIMTAGNFGHYDERKAHIEVREGHLSYQLQKARRRFCRNLRFLTSYPEEVIFEPFARVGHTLWRKFRLYRF